MSFRMCAWARTSIRAHVASTAYALLRPGGLCLLTRGGMDRPEDTRGIRGSFEELTAHIAARLRKACAAMPDEEFAELVTDIARMKLRFDEIDLRFGRSLPAHPGAERRPE